MAAKIVKEIRERLGFLVNVGLDYLTLDRSADTLSGGEAQRIRLASQVGAGLVGVMYVPDEPSIGLHQRDNQRLLDTLLHLRDIGNTVIVVEHDEDAIRAADYVVDIGPGAGIHGGKIVAEGTPQAVMDHPDSLTGQYLSGRLRIEVPAERWPFDPERVLRLKNARGNNLKGMDAVFPVGLLTCVTGVSGSGKSTLVNDTLYRLAARALHGAGPTPTACDGIEGLEQFDKVIDIDQSPIGRTPRSNPATYTGLFTPIRELFAQVPEARARLSAGAVQLQRQGRALRGLCRRWGHQGGDALPARHLRALRCLQGQALQPRDPGSPLQGQDHSRSIGPDGGGRGGVFHGDTNSSAPAVMDVANPADIRAAQHLDRAFNAMIAKTKILHIPLL